MASTTSGARGRTRTGSRPAAGGSAAKSMARDTTSGAQPTSATVPAATEKRASQRKTPSMAREILSQSVIDAAEAGLNVRVYETTRGSVAIELMAHRVVDGVIVPAGDQN